MNDEDAIRELQQTWIRASQAGDAATVADLMTNDIVFLTAGRPPFGKREFLESFEAMAGKVTMTGSGHYEEIIVVGDVAYTRAKLDITITTTSDAASKQLAGYALSVLRRGADGKWRICRDANLVVPKQG
jgi:uncharacterized protein (TIGR02246 family)